MQAWEKGEEGRDARLKWQGRKRRVRNQENKKKDLTSGFAFLAWVLRSKHWAASAHVWLLSPGAWNHLPHCAVIMWHPMGTWCWASNRKPFLCEGKKSRTQVKFWALPFFEKCSIKCSTHLYFEFNSHHFHRGNRSFSLQVSSTVAYFVVKELNYFPRVAITNYHKLPFKKHRNLFPNSSGGGNSEIKVSAGPSSLCDSG